MRTTGKNLAELKSGGFIPQKQKNRFSLRLKIIGGSISVEQLHALLRITDEFGAGHIHLTSRQSVEIPFVKLRDVAKIQEAMKKNGLEPGCIGPGIRTITACQGNTVCACGLINSGDIARAIDSQFGALRLPHKFKIGVTGCPNNCLKVEANDLGVKGAIVPDWTPDACVYCGLCAKICPVKAITVQDNSLTYDKNNCIHCGKCVKRCPKSSWSETVGYLFFFGGTFGNNLRFGQPFLPVITKKKSLLRVIDCTLAFFAKHGKSGERFAFTLERIGWNAFVDHLRSLKL